MKTKFKLLFPTIALAAIGFSQEVHYIYDDAGVIDYRLQMGNQQYYNINDYDSHWQKVSIASLKGLFNHLFIGL